MENHKLINRALLKQYGKDIAGRPFWRITQNGRGTTEKRQGIFRTFYGSIFIREEFGVKEVPKYNYIPEGYWILERLFINTSPEIVDIHCYEPVWVFMTPITYEYQKPNLKACQFLIKSALSGPKKSEDWDEKGRKEEELFYEMLGGDAGISDLLHMGAGVSYSGLDPRSESCK